MGSDGSVLRQKAGDQMAGCAVFLSGPIGSGKTTLGRAVAVRLDAAFLDGDDYADQTRPWYGSSLSTSRRIAAAGLAACAEHPVAVIAYPLRCANYVYYRRRFTDAGHRAIFVSLRASAAAILAPSRGRSFDAGERARIAEMIAQGYAYRPFSDLVVDTDAAGFDATVEILVARLTPLVR
jgi:hypothetical protein